MSPYEEHAARLIERGYQVVPVIPGTKKPGYFCNGTWVGMKAWASRFNGRASLQAARQQWFGDGAGIGVLGGPASGDLIGVDTDTEVPDIVAALLTALPPSPVKKIGAKGETRFYRGPGIASESWTIRDQRIVEIIGPGRQTLLPPTLHPDTGQPYRWLTPDTLEDVSPHELPVLPPDIAIAITQVLEPFGYQPEPQRESGDSDSPHRRLNDEALARLGDWVPMLGLYKMRRSARGYEAVAVWRPSSTGRANQARNRNLKISPAGIRDFGADTGYTALDLVMAALGCDLETAFTFLAQRLNWEAAIDIKLAGGNGHDQAALGTLGNAGNAGNAGNGQPPEAGDAKSKPPEPDALEPLTHLPGAVGDIVDWITSTARRPNRVLALGAALTVVGTLIGRRVAGPTYSATHLYIVTVAPATAGKDHPRRCILPLFEAAKAGTHVHLGDITSQSGFNRAMKANPLCLVAIDEIAGFLGRISSPKSSFWERRLSGKLREQWSCSFGAIGTMTSAEYDDVHIQCPAMSIFGTSTNNEFWSVLQGAEVENGFFSRFLVFASNYLASEQDPLNDPFKVPKPLAAQLAVLYCWGGSKLSLASLSDPGTHFKPQVLPWATTEAHDCYRELVQWVERELSDDMSKQAYFGRIAETAVRLATIRAAGRAGSKACVDLEDMRWGADVASIAITGMMRQSLGCLPETVRGEFVDKLIRIIREQRT